jgi:hypothetical protein
MGSYHKTGLMALLIFLLCLLSGCQFYQSAFANTAGNTGSAFAAAKITIIYVHEGKITPAYARSVFVTYQSELSGLDQSLPTLNGAPDQHQMQQLLALYKQAMQVVQQPCLDNGCDWRHQVVTLHKASQAFLQAGGS